MKKVLIPILIVVVVGALAAGAYLYFGARRAQSSSASNVSTATVQLGTLQATIGAAGNVTAKQQADLSFGQGGTVKSIDVQAGDRVKAGQLLAALDTANLELQLRNAQVNLKNAQDKLAQTQNPSTTQDIASARAKVEAAQAAYDKTVAGASQADLAASKAGLASAQAAYDAAVKSAGTSNSQLEASAASLEKARIAVQQAQSAYDKISWQSSAATSSQAATLQSATIDFEQAKANYEALAATTNSDASSKVAQARSSLEQAKANLTKLQTQVTQADITSAQATLTQAKNDLDKLLAGPDANTLDLAQNAVDQAQIAVDQAQLALQQAQIIAPFDGIVTQVNVKLGQNASGGGNSIQIADLDHLQSVINMSEIDINRIKQGQTAQITMDALPNDNFQGTVTLIAPAGVLSQGVVNYPVTVDLTPPFDGVKTGMTSNVSIIVDQRNNVLTVPNRAIRTQGRQKVVTVLFEGQQMQVPVQTGLASDTATEITSGLKEGDVVVLNTTTATQPRVGGGFGGGPGGPGIFRGD
jgi:HlyD family secretion protein